VSAPALHDAAGYHRALTRAGGCVTAAARALGVAPCTVSRAARRHGLRTNPGGGRPRQDVCWLRGAPVLADGEFAALYRDVGTKQLAALLDQAPGAVSGRALRLGLRGRRP
jgi:hypothetical protein